MKAEPSRKVYIPIIIKTKADLPKETDDYNVLIKGRERREMQHFDIIFWADELWWLKNVDSYLLPVDLPTDEEIEIWAYNKYHEVENATWFTPLIFGAKWLRNKLLNR